MKWCKRVAFSLNLGLLGAALLWLSSQTPELLLPAKKELAAVTQTKTDVQRSYCSFNEENSFFLTMSYPTSHLFRDKDIIEEIDNLQAEALDASSHNSFVATKARIDYGSHILEAKEAHVTREVAAKPLLNALVKDITLYLKESSPTFEARGITAEITP